MLETNKMKIDYGEYWLVFEQNPDKEYEHEVWCYLEVKATHEIIQDIAIIRSLMSMLATHPK